MFLSKKSLQKSIKLFPIDFTKPWWSLIANQKWLVLLIATLIIIVRIFWSISPFFIAYMFQSASPVICAFIFALWIFMDCCNVYSRQLNAQFQLQCIHSIYQNAHQYLLTVDPRYHVHRSSGAILGKIDRAARGYEDLLDQVTFEFLPLLVGLVTMIVALSKYSKILALIVSIFFICMVILGYYFSIYYCHNWERKFIESDDAFRSTAVENLAQVQLVRATFACDYMSDKLNKKIEHNSRIESGLWLSYTTTQFILNMLYLLILFGLLSFLAWQVYYCIINIASAIGMSVAYIHSTKDLVAIMKPFRRYMRAWTAVKDLFEFIPNFGKQSYPTLGPTINLPTKTENIIIEAQNISFDYQTANLFNNHTFSLKCTHEQANKLYGIIGPSGSGKTTLLSILGGQLKPIIGTVYINSIDIYAITDAIRRQLIALQGQTATNVRGTVKYNLLFGLPQNNNYSDEYLLEVLDRVGLMGVLSSLSGLNTMLGEGGLNLSGGQRQRINFAGLYLRAKFYKPSLILIDEPTSSLDELSEAAITEMIMELAESAVTLVIAHRLKTLEDAIGLIDLSLLPYEKEIVAYLPNQLISVSAYYRKLVQGHIQLDS